MTWPAFYDWLLKRGFKHTPGDVHYAGAGWWFPALPVNLSQYPVPGPWIHVEEAHEQGLTAAFVGSALGKEHGAKYAESPAAARAAVEDAMMRWDQHQEGNFGDFGGPPSPIIAKWLVGRGFVGMRRGASWYWIKEFPGNASTKVTVSYHSAEEVWHIDTRTSGRMEFRRSEERQVMDALQSIIHTQHRPWEIDEDTDVRTRPEGITLSHYGRRDRDGDDGGDDEPYRTLDLELRRMGFKRVEDLNVAWWRGPIFIELLENRRSGMVVHCNLEGVDNVTFELDQLDEILSWASWAIDKVGA